MGIPYEFRVEWEVHYLDAIFSAITNTQMNRERGEKINISNRAPTFNPILPSHVFYVANNENYGHKPARVHCETVREHAGCIWFGGLLYPVRIYRILFLAAMWKICIDRREFRL